MFIFFVVACKAPVEALCQSLRNHRCWGHWFGSHPGRGRQPCHSGVRAAPWPSRPLEPEVSICARTVLKCSRIYFRLVDCTWLGSPQFLWRIGSLPWGTGIFRVVAECTLIDRCRCEDSHIATRLRDDKSDKSPMAINGHRCVDLICFVDWGAWHFEMLIILFFSCFSDHFWILIAKKSYNIVPLHNLQLFNLKFRFVKAMSW